MCLCVCDCMRNGKESSDIRKQNERLIKEEKGKKFMFAYWHTCEKPCVIYACVCQRLSLKSKEKRLFFFFLCLCFIQQDTRIHITISIMNCVYTLLSREWRKFYSLISNHQLTPIVYEASAAWALTPFSCDWIHHTGAPELWPLWKWTWSFNLSPLTSSGHMVS